MNERLKFFNLLNSKGKPGRVNMAEDLYLLDRYRFSDDFTVCPTLRIYYFNPPALSLGFFQKKIDLRLALKAKQAGCDIVTRPTGGRAVLHKNEITYSIIASFKNGIFAGNLLESYKKIRIFLYIFFMKTGLKPDANIVKTSNGKNENRKISEVKSFNCFLKASSYEITIGGKKICGSAQRRNETAFLQHGSIYIDYNPAEHIEFFENGEQKKEYFDKVTGIKQELQKNGLIMNFGYEHLSGLLKSSFSEVYNLMPRLFSFTQDEVDKIAVLAKELSENSKNNVTAN